ncbi:hypothetical protein Tco_1463113, partial [Tanacetum coccineum]
MKSCLKRPFKSTNHLGVFTSGPYTIVLVDPNNYDLILLGPTLYAKVTSELSRKSVNFRTLITPARNGVDVVVPLESIRANSERFANTAYSFFLGKRVAYPVVANYFRNTWGKYGLVKSLLNSSTGLFSFQFSFMDGLDSMLDNEDVGNVPVWVKLHGVLVKAFSEDGLSSISTKVGTPLMFESYTSDMCSDMPKNLKNHSQAPRGVPVGPKVGFKPVKQVYRCVSKKNNVNTSVSSSISTTPIVDKIDKLEKLIIDGKISLVDDEGKPLKKVDYPGDHDSEDEVEEVHNEMASFLALERLAL